MGNLHKWFSGSKSKDGKSGWVNVKTGGTCASDEPGEGTPKCVSSSKRASMTKSERESASRRKKSADPGQQQKSGAAKPTYVSTDKPKKMKKEQFSNWKDDYVPTEHEFIDLIKPEPMVGISETKEGQMKSGREQYKKEKKEGRYGGTKPSNERVASLMKKLKEEYKKLPKRKMGMKAGNKIISAAGHAGKAGAEEEGTIENQIRMQKAGKKAKQADKIHKTAGKHNENLSKLKSMKNKLVGMTKEELEISEEDKKGSGSGKKDACYKKVKASASVWPSAYASGRLVQCRKKGADNYGNSTKNEEWKPDPTEKRKAKSAKLGREEEIEKGKSKKYGRDEDKIKDLYKRRIAVDFKKKKSSIGEERLEELKCWKGYKRKKGSTPGAPGSCVKESFTNWRDDLSLMEGVSAWQRKEGQNPEGGLNKKGRESAKADGHDLKAPQPEGGDRKDSFCARMGGMKEKLTSAKTANDPDSRINKALRKWKCNN